MMKLLTAILALLLLSACISFGEEPPPFLLTLSPAQSVAAGASRSQTDGQPITYNQPQIPQKLSTNRLVVASGETRVAYFPNAVWTDTPNALFRDLLSEVTAARTGRIVLDPRQYTSEPGIIVSGQLHEFGYDSLSREVVVRYDAMINVTGQGVRSRRFEAREPVSVEEPQYLADALNRAANRVAAEVSDWVVG